MIPDINRPNPNITIPQLPVSSDQESLKDLTAIFHKTLPQFEGDLMRQISKHPQQNIVAKLVRWLDHNEILTKTTTQAALDHRNAHILLSLTELISDTESLKESKFMYAAKARPYTLAGYLKLLEMANIPKKDYISFEGTDVNLILRKRVMSVLQKEGNLTEEKLKSLIQVEKILKDTELLTKKDLLKCMEHAKPEDYAEALIMLKNSNLLTQDFKTFTLYQLSPQNYALAITLLQDKELLTGPIAETVSMHENPIEFARGITWLSQYKNLTQTNITRLLVHVNPVEYAEALTILDRNSASKPHDYKMIADAEKPLDLVKGWNILLHYNILTDNNKRFLADCREDYENIAKAMGMLSARYLLKEENLELLYDSLEPLTTAEALCCLDKLNLLTDSNRELLFGTDPQVFEAIKVLSNAKILDQDGLMWLVSGDISRAEAVLFLGITLSSESYFLKLRNHKDPLSFAKGMY